MTACRTCELVQRRDAGGAPPWDQIVRTPTWDVAHAFGTTIEGWTVLVLRRHVASVAELTDAEAAELGPLITRVSRALQETVGCVKTYVAQFAEHPEHRHVHVHLIPRAEDLADDRQGPRIFSELGVPEDRSVPEARMNEIAADLQRHLDVPG